MLLGGREGIQLRCDNKATTQPAPATAGSRARRRSPRFAWPCREAAKESGAPAHKNPGTADSTPAKRSAEPISRRVQTAHPSSKTTATNSGRQTARCAGRRPGRWQSRRPTPPQTAMMIISPACGACRDGGDGPAWPPAISQKKRCVSRASQSAGVRLVSRVELMARPSKCVPTGGRPTAHPARPGPAAPRSRAGAAAQWRQT